MQEIIIIAGPNGAGKTSFAKEYLPAAREGLVYVNADEIARELAGLDPTAAHLDLRAGREMLSRIDSLVAARTEFMFGNDIGITELRPKDSKVASAWVYRGGDLSAPA